MPYHPTGPSRRAFSLTELLLVLAVLAILLALLIPAVRTMSESAAGIRCLSQVRNLAMANLVYATNNRNVLVPAFKTAWNGDGSWDDTWAYWTHNEEFLAGIEPNGTDGTWSDKTRCPRSWQGTRAFERNYALNLSAPGYRFDASVWFRYRPNSLVSARLNQIPGDTAWFTDAVDWLVLGEAQSQGWTLASEADPSTWDAKVAYRHRDRANIARADGGALAMRRQEVDPATPEGQMLWTGR